MKQAFGTFGKTSAFSAMLALSFGAFAMAADNVKTFDQNTKGMWGGAGFDNYLVTVNKGVTVDGQTNTAISLGNDNTLNISGTVQNSTASMSGGHYNTGPNVVEVRSRNTVRVLTGAMLNARGTSSDAEAFNPHGVGNTLIIEDGAVIHGGHNTHAIWFQNKKEYLEDSKEKNKVENHGMVIRGGIDPNQGAEVMGASAGAGIDFTNYSTGKVYGSLKFESNDNHLTLYGGSLITGKIEAQKGKKHNIVALTGESSGPVGDFNNVVSGFNQLRKEGSGQWNIQRGSTLSSFDEVMVNKGTLHVDYRDAAKTGNVTKTGKAIRVYGGTLSVDNPNNTAVGDVDVYSGGRLEGVGNVGNVASAGVIAPGHERVPTGILRINGNYEAGEGAILEISTVLGDDNSPTSRLHITGNTSGNVTLLRENNIGGHGHDTIHGIKVVQVDGKSDGHAFALDSNFSYKGIRIIHVDDYAYYLHEGDQADGSGSSYYLSAMHEDVVPAGVHGLGTGPGPQTDANSWPATGTGGDPGDSGGTGGTGGTGGSGTGGTVIGGQRPVQTPAPRLMSTLVPLYEALPRVMLDMNRMGGMQDRNGNRNWAAFDPCNPCAPEGYVSSVDGFGMWTTVEGGHGKQAPKWSTTPYEYDMNYYRVKLGLEGPLAKLGSCGTLVGGVYGQYGRADSDIRSDHLGFGEVNLDQWGVGAYATWLGSNGFYVDLQGQANWYGIDMITGSGTSSIAAGSKILDDGHGFGWATSLELGKSFAFGRGWAITPQAQIQYSKIRFNSFDTPAGNQSINYDKGDNLLGRIGFSVDKTATFTSECGSVRKLHAYGAVNAYYDFRGETAAYSEYHAGGAQTRNHFRSDNSRLELGAKVGATYTWADDKYSVFAEVGVRGATKKFKDNYSVDGKVGFGVNF